LTSFLLLFFFPTTFSPFFRYRSIFPGFFSLATFAVGFSFGFCLFWSLWVKNRLGHLSSSACLDGSSFNWASPHFFLPPLVLVFFCSYQVACPLCSPFYPFFRCVVYCSRFNNLPPPLTFFLLVLGPSWVSLTLLPLLIVSLRYF